jgi:hypothetical protein
MPAPLPKCFNLLNLTYFANLTLRIDNVGTAAELQALINEVFADLSVLESVMTSQIALLLPLTSAPTDLGSVISWITSFINSFIGPYANLALQLTALAAQVAILIAAIEAVAAAKGFSVTIPSVGVVCTL